MTAQQRECPSEQTNPDPVFNPQDTVDSEQSLNSQDFTDLQDWIKHVRQQHQTKPDFEEWATQVRTQMLKSLSKRTASC